MKGYLNTQRKADCFGCGSCFQACPQCAISMETDAEGFEYPKVDNTRCISCNLCHKSCPTEFPVTMSIPEAGAVGYNVEPIVRLKSKR